MRLVLRVVTARSLRPAFGCVAERGPPPTLAQEDHRVSLRPLAREFIPCPKGLHRATYRRLLRAHGRIVAQLERLPYRRTWPVVRKRLQTEFQNRLNRVRRRLGLRVPHPPARRWYRTSEAAAFVGVSSKTLLR